MLDETKIARAFRGPTSGEEGYEGISESGCFDTCPFSPGVDRAFRYESGTVLIQNPLQSPMHGGDQEVFSMKSLSSKLGVILICTWIVSVGCSKPVTIKGYDHDMDRLVKTWGEDWTLLNKPSHVDYYAHSKSINHLPNGNFRVWIRTLFRTKPQYTEKEGPIDYYQTLEEFDCLNQRYRYIYTESFDKKGARIGSPWQDENSKWLYVKPDDDYGVIFTKLCR
jgi:hypothetical protein